ncbi:hypothetical protein BDV12DRAFT_169007 [Aspergillus spectabilis]
MVSAGAQMAKTALNEGSKLAGKGAKWAAKNPKVATATAAAGVLLAAPGIGGCADSLDRWIWCRRGAGVFVSLTSFSSSSLSSLRHMLTGDVLA